MLQGRRCEKCEFCVKERSEKPEEKGKPIRYECWRYPVEVEKQGWQGCGEFEPKTIFSALERERGEDR
jgi:hypothetical protein